MYRKRQYTVTVTASNKFSNKSASLSVFILHKPCGAPEVDSLIPTNSRLEVTRSQDFKLEYKVKINCSITSAANYTWTLRNSTTGEQIHLKNVPKEAFHDPILYLPRHTLNYGNYSVELMVINKETCSIVRYCVCVFAWMLYVGVYVYVFIYVCV